MNLSIFKPALPKIISASILLLICVPFIYYDTGVRCIQAPCNASSLGSVIDYLINSYHFRIYSQGIHYDYALMGALFSYIMICLIWKFYKRKD